jgi:signal transduction histidine kinase
MPPELQPVAQRLNEMLGRLEAAFTQQKRFIADAAHELRTPVAALRTTLEVAMSRPMPTKAAAMRVSLERSLACAVMLGRLVEALLDHARTDRAEAFPPEPADMAKLLEECRHTTEPLATAKGVTLQIAAAPQIACTLNARALSAILLNLLSNAIEHTDAGGGVSVACSLERDQLMLAVTDTGRGISPQDLPHIFEPFYRGDGARGADGGHLGLGLFLVQSNVRKMGGTIDVESKVGTGTEFMARIPLHGPPAAALTSLPSENPEFHSGLMNELYHLPRTTTS